MIRDLKNQLSGKEIFEIHPIILGGSPTDPKNKIILTREQHIQAVNYWNRVITEIRLGKEEKQNDPKEIGE